MCCARFKDHFSASSRDYARHRPRYPLALASYLARSAPARACVWDCGCGSGQLSVRLAEVFAHVVATDASAEQVAAAIPHPRIEYRRASAEASGLAAGSVDAVVAAQAAHWFDLPAFYGEVRRVARTDAILALVTYGQVTVDVSIDPLVRRFYREVLGPYWPPERRHVEEGYRTLDFPFPELTAPRLEMRARWMLAGFCGYLRTWSAVRRLERDRGSAAFDAFCAELARAWGEPHRRRAIRWPLALRVGRI